MFERSHIYISIVLFSTLLIGCGKQIPKEVIKPSQMEDIIYDYNLANVMSDELQFNDFYKKELYNKYVFEKHKVTSEQFDSSLLWYSKHADELRKIYRNVDKRFAKNRDIIDAATATIGSTKSRTLSGDTIDIWDKSNLIWLTTSEITNKVIFSATADTSFRANDIYIFEGDFQFLSKGKQNAVVGINLVLQNDSIVGKTKEILSSGPNVLYFNTNVAPNKVKSVNAFIYYKGERKLSGMLANNLTLNKIHSNEPAITVSDTALAIKPAEPQIPERITVNIDQDSTITDTTAINNGEPQRNDPRSIRERTPRRQRQN